MLADKQSDAEGGTLYGVQLLFLFMNSLLSANDMSRSFFLACKHNW